MRTAPVWEEQDLLAGRERPVLPPLEGELSTSVCVVGLGASGLTALRELQRHGVPSVGLDAGRIASGAAGRNGGFLLAGLARPYHQVVTQLGRSEAARLYRLTLEELQRTGAPLTGSLRIEDTAAGLADCRLQREALLADGFEAQEYDGPEGRGLLLPQDGATHPVRRCLSLAGDLTGLHESSPVLDIQPGLVTTPRGRVRCEAVLVMVDGGLDRLLPELASRVRTVRLQMLATAPTDEVRLTRPVYVRDGYDYWQQLPDGRLAIGGCRDVGGADEETTQTEPTAPVQQAIEEIVRDRLGVTAPVTHRWAASVGFTPDGLPFVGQVRDGVWAAGGYCGTGNIIGALAGRALASAAAGLPDPAGWPVES